MLCLLGSVFGYTNAGIYVNNAIFRAPPCLFYQLELGFLFDTCIECNHRSDFSAFKIFYTLIQWDIGKNVRVKGIAWIAKRDGTIRLPGTLLFSGSKGKCVGAFLKYSTR